MSTAIAVEYYPKATAHWYTRDGEPMHTYTNTKGKLSKTTLREARKYDLVPSVTNILSMVPKPSIVGWKVRHAIAAGCETGDPKAAVELFDERTSSAAKTGTRYHKALEEMLTGGLSIGALALKYDVPVATLDAVMMWVTVAYEGKDYRAETPFCSDEYGGCIDLWAPNLITDFKTSENPKSWPEHAYQVAAYNNAMPADEQCILLISTSQPGVIEPVMFTAEQIEYGWRVFRDAQRMWQTLNKWEGAK